MNHRIVLVAGTGKSGIGAAKLLLQSGTGVILYDENQELNKDVLKEKCANDENVKIHLGELTKEILKGVHLCVISPGISLDKPFVQVIKSCGIPIWGEVELAYRFAKGRLAAITGTNGKTTTTALCGSIFKAYFPETYIVGNIGVSYTSQALKMSEQAVTVAEISSFQLETVQSFKPDVSAILNITPDHLNRHKAMEEYVRVKEQIALKQTKQEVCVLNYEVPYLLEFSKTIPAKVRFFSSKRQLKEGAFLKDGNIVVRLLGEESSICHISELNILGEHNYENVMAAVLISLSMGVPLSVVQTQVKAFQSVEHRIEYVTTRDGVTYYNDSKGTNPDAAIRAVEAMTEPTVLIAGGYDKNGSYREWIKTFSGKVKKLILIGETKEKIAHEAEALGFFEYLFADNLEEAVEIARQNAVSGDAVLLSPACASWDMFSSYEERGLKFKELANS